RLASRPRRRRYSGGLFNDLSPLPRGRYSTVCSRENGFDGGVLFRELAAYAGSRKRKRITVFDNISSATMERPSAPHLAVYFEDPSGEIAGRLISDGHGTAIKIAPGNPSSVGINLYYSLSDVEMERVIDLRLPSTQRWFFETFRFGFGELWRKP